MKRRRKCGRTDQPYRTDFLLISQSGLCRQWHYVEEWCRPVAGRTARAADSCHRCRISSSRLVPRRAGPRRPAGGCLPFDALDRSHKGAGARRIVRSARICRQSAAYGSTRLGTGLIRAPRCRPPSVVLLMLPGRWSIQIGTVGRRRVGEDEAAEWGRSGRCRGMIPAVLCRRRAGQAASASNRVSSISARIERSGCDVAAADDDDVAISSTICQCRPRPARALPRRQVF